MNLKAENKEPEKSTCSCLTNRLEKIRKEYTFDKPLTTAISAECSDIQFLLSVIDNLKQALEEIAENPKIIGFRAWDKACQALASIKESKCEHGCHKHKYHCGNCNSPLTYSPANYSSRLEDIPNPCENCKDTSQDKCGHRRLNNDPRWCLDCGHRFGNTSQENREKVKNVAWRHRNRKAYDRLSKDIFQESKCEHKSICSHPTCAASKSRGKRGVKHTKEECANSIPCCHEDTPQESKKSTWKTPNSLLSKPEKCECLCGHIMDCSDFRYHKCDKQDCTNGNTCRLKEVSAPQESKCEHCDDPNWIHGKCCGYPPFFFGPGKCNKDTPQESKCKWCKKHHKNQDPFCDSERDTPQECEHKGKLFPLYRKGKQVKGSWICAKCSAAVFAKDTPQLARIDKLWIAERIKAEYQKHAKHGLPWEDIAAIKIESEIRRRILGCLE